MLGFLPFFHVAAYRYLQPMMETVWALLGLHALDVEDVGEVQSDGKARFYRNDVLAGHSMRGRGRVSWTEQMSF